MFRTKLRAMVAAVAVGVGVVGGAVAQKPDEAVGQTIVLREPGKPDRRCLIESSRPNVGGEGTLYTMKNLDTGEVVTIVDKRPAQDGRGALLNQILATRGSKGLQATVKTTASPLAAAPCKGCESKTATAAVPTNAALASQKGATEPMVVDAPKAPAPMPTLTHTKPMGSPYAQPTTPHQAYIGKLKDALGPSEREVAVVALMSGPAKTNPEVVAAIMSAAKDDPAPTVRAACVKHMSAISDAAPQVIPVLQEMQTDSSDLVATAAQKAMLQLAKKHHGK